VTDRDDALRATTGDLIADAEELEAIEHRKASLDPADPRQDGLAARAEALVRQMVPKAAAQREIVNGAEDPAPDDRDAAIEPEPETHREPA
jgi:hypothetical protein